MIAGNTLPYTMKEDWCLVNPSMTASREEQSATNSLKLFLNKWFRCRKRCSCKGDDLCWPRGCLNAGATGDTFSVAIDGTTISATVGAGVTAGTYGIASLVTDLNAANQALATPVAITFSASGSDLLATANNAASNLICQLQFNVTVVLLARQQSQHAPHLQ